MNSKEILQFLTRCQGELCSSQAWKTNIIRQLYPFYVYNYFLICIGSTQIGRLFPLFQNKSPFQKKSYYEKIDYSHCTILICL